MFHKILIANRGEIACRVMETANKMGVRTVAVYSDADRTAKHVALADEAVHIGPSAPGESYLLGNLMIATALATGAEAIHPGYGFLSENPDFVEEVEAAGLVFVGPSASAICAMGLKDAAKRLMQDAGVPVVPGYHGKNQENKHLTKMAEEIGYPVLIKAVAGGGGKGMRKVERPTDFADALASARGEALTAFGNDAVLIEKYVEQPRHIEVQVFGDGFDAVHLFERDCSLQRRHQKVIEEAPAPGMTHKMRATMGEAAVKAAKAIGYSGAGTVEFIVDASDGLRADRFWFMEMNTRLQVEHPVTEAITGVDLVEWQLRVAAGESLPARQEDLSITGHAFEARLYAEDVPKGFLPATGTLTHLKFPEGVRADSGVRANDVISSFYDPMIAKLTVHGPTRAVALLKMEQALAATEVAGSVTNLAFLGALTRHQGFAAGDVDTGLIERDLDELIVEPMPSDNVRAMAALVALGLDQRDDWATGFSLWQPVPQALMMEYGDEIAEVTVASRGNGDHVVSVGEISVTAKRIGGSWMLDGQVAPKGWMRKGANVSVFDGHGFQFRLIDPLDQDIAAAAGGNVIAAPMPGLVKSVFVSAGANVQAGDRLAILEAMKMEHALTAARDGVIKEVLAAEGDQVEAGAALILLAGEEFAA